MAILQAELSDLQECTDIIFSSELGKKYFPQRALLETEVSQGIKNDKVYVYRTGEEVSAISGIVWYQLEGMFHSFPYLHMIVVKGECQNQGVGTALLDFFEADVLESGKNHIRTKIFLTVGDFNQHAEKIYQKRGYKKICDLPGLYRNKITERFYMKIVTAAE